MQHKKNLYMKERRCHHHKYCCFINDPIRECVISFRVHLMQLDFMYVSSTKCQTATSIYLSTGSGSDGDNSENITTQKRCHSLRGDCFWNNHKWHIVVSVWCCRCHFASWLGCLIETHVLHRIYTFSTFKCIRI